MNYTNEYQAELKELHKKKTFGVNKEISPEVIDCIEKYNITSILDFGCGKGLMVENLKKRYPNIRIYGYDPAQEQYDKLPDSVDMIMSSDVLEHIEPELLEQTLIDLKQRCTKVMYHLIACHPAKKTLSDGRNAHLIIKEPNWWRSVLEKNIGWSFEKEYNLEFVATFKKREPMNVLKYIVILRKDYGNT
jgi:SAM-dependent methyltransferase